MILGLDVVMVFLTLFIPLAIVYFQEKNSLTEKYLEYFLDIKRITLTFFIGLLLIFFASVADQFDIPSKIGKFFIGKQELIALILSLLLLVPTTEIGIFYAKYFQFKRQTQSRKIQDLLGHISRSMQRHQTHHRWIETNQLIETSLTATAGSVRDGVPLKYQGRRLGVVGSFRIKKVAKKFPELYLIITCGSELVPGRRLGYLPAGTHRNLDQVERELSAAIGVSPDFEEKLTELLKVVIAEIQADIPSRLYVPIEANLGALLEGLSLFAKSNCVFHRYYEVMGYLYFFLGSLGETDDKQLRSIMVRFNQSLLLEMIHKDNRSMIGDFMGLSLRKQFLDIYGDETVNSGIVYFLFDVLYTLQRLDAPKEGLLARFASLAYKLIQSLSEDELQSVKAQIDEKSYLLRSNDIEPVAYVLQIIYAMTTGESEILVEAHLEEVDVFRRNFYSIEPELREPIMRLAVVSSIPPDRQ